MGREWTLRVPGHPPTVIPDARLDRAERDVAREPESSFGQFKKSPHFGVEADVPHGMIGTAEVEFFGLPSISLSV